MEASFCGPKPVKFEPHRGKAKAPTAQELNYHFNTQDYLELGQNLCKTLAELSKTLAEVLRISARHLRKTCEKLRKRFCRTNH